jgi:Leucine-rich repeat (LRR) protein
VCFVQLYDAGMYEEQYEGYEGEEEEGYEEQWEGYEQQQQQPVVFQLPTLDRAAAQLTSLQQLEVQQRTWLTRLNVQRNALQELRLSGLPQLTALDASNNRLSTVQLSALDALQELRLAHNYPLLQCDVQCSALRLLSLDCCWGCQPLLNAPRTLPSSLQTLLAQSCAISALQDDALPAGLETLDLSHNALKTLNVTRLTALQSLTLAHNPALNSLKANPKTLRLLDLTNCALTECPDWLLDCGALETLRLVRNKLRALPDKLFHRLMTLTSLIVSRNNLTALPDFPAAGVPSSPLQVLDASWNSLRALPKALPTRLTNFGVAFNELTSLEGCPTSLTSLDASFNSKLVSLPSTFAQATGLVTLRLAHNGMLKVSNFFFGLGTLFFIFSLLLGISPSPFSAH